MTSKPLILSGAALVMAFSLSTQADWLQFRGPGGTGIAPDDRLPARLDSSRDLAWAASLPGRGLSSPIVVGDRVFLTCSSGPRQERLHVICFRAADGGRLWERQFWATGRTMCHEVTSVAAPTPVSDGQVILATFSSNDAVCLDLEGNLVWFRGLGRDYPNASNSVGMSASPVFVGGVFVVQAENESESFAVGLDRATGVNLWKLDRPKDGNWTSPLAYRDTTGRELALLQSAEGLAGVDPRSGKILWEFKSPASTIPSSVVAGNRVYVPCVARGLTALEPLTDGSAPREIWAASQLRAGVSSPLILGTNAFTLNSGGILTCGEAVSGQRLWQLRLKGPMSASPVVSGKLMYCVNEKGLMQVVDITRQPEGEVVHKLDLAATILCTPAITGGALYVRSDTTLWRFGAASARLTTVARP
jgi:outer membrane protein assembly factor BamB